MANVSMEPTSHRAEIGLAITEARRFFRFKFQVKFQNDRFLAVVVGITIVRCTRIRFRRYRGLFINVKGLITIVSVQTVN